MINHSSRTFKFQLFSTAICYLKDTHYVYDVTRIICISNKVYYYTLLLFYVLSLVNCMQINATITQSAENSAIC